jgi:primosomal protein N' (replication factor Y)
MERSTLFVDVIVPLGLPQLFSYRIPLVMNGMIKPLQRVIIPFGKRKKYTAIVYSVHETPPQKYEAKYIEAIIEEDACINPIQLKFWEWIAEYYMCSLGEVMQAALPAGLKLSSETVLRQYGKPDEELLKSLNDREFMVMEALAKAGQLSVKDVEQIAGIKTVYPIIKKLMEYRLLSAEEEMRDTFKQKTETWLSLPTEYFGEEGLNKLIEQLKRAPKQQEVILAFLSLGNMDVNAPGAVKKTDLVKKLGSNATALNALLKKDIFVAEDRIVSRLGGIEQDDAEFLLSAAQELALDQINEAFAEKQTVLFHGLTGSGKTEIYIRLIAEQLEKGKQVLYLLPEIALTAQIIHRLRKHFGRKVQVYHSKFSENERVEVWNAVADAEKETGALILGARSSVFLPFQNLGLVLIDEEHEPTFKQYEPAPRYNARDAAMVLATFHDAKVLLGSATPSLESYYKAQSGKYGLVKLQERFGGAQLPKIILNDLREDTKRRRMKGIFSPLLVEGIESTLKGNKQVILFQNRRGFAPMLQCQKCQWVPQCVQCDISLTYHKAIHQLRCHYCGYSLNVPSTCAVCGSPDIRFKGFGTEKIEEELNGLMPEVSSARMDLDTTRSKYSYHKLIEDFEQQRIQVLIGTQMVSKGLDFNEVKLVGVLNADAMLKYPDFRSYERSFQLLSQVAGRAGRKSEPGTVMIQTWEPAHPVLQMVKDHNYELFFEVEIEERRKYNYPPFSRLIHVTLKNEVQNGLDEAAEALANYLRATFGTRILGPEYPAMMKVRNMFQKRILIKIENGLSLSKFKSTLKTQIAVFFQQFPLKNFRLTIDVDPAG